MNNFLTAPSTVSIALNFPAPEVEALMQGRMIVANSRTFIAPGRIFALNPSALSIFLPIEDIYHASFLSIAKTALEDFNSRPVAIKAWAVCELCQILDNSTHLDAVAKLTVWTVEALKEFLSRQQRIFLTYLRVYRFPEQIEFHTYSRSQFVNLPNSLDTSKTSPVLESHIFNQRKQQLIELRLPAHLELEELITAIASLIPPTPAAQTLCQEVKALIGWSLEGSYGLVDSDLGWIRELVNIGNSSDGYAFEKLVRKSLIKLGFTNSQNNSLDPEATGGAGGLDVYCDAPFSLVGECKASRYENVPNGVAAQLINLGNTHLGRVCFDHAIKVIFSAGRLTSAAQKAAVENQMNIIRPETLQRLVELKAHHPGSINLLELKPCLQKAPFGEEADDKVNQYIDRIWQELKVRSRIIQVVKELSESDPERKQFEVVEIRVHYNATAARVSGNVLDNQTVHELLIELASPFAGYLGRLQGMSLPSDRFYYLRDLVVNL